MIYIVQGSEDGYIATYGSKKKAMDAAIEYILMSVPDEEMKNEFANIEINESQWYISLYGTRINSNITIDQVRR